jgi:hypothetical protein
VLLYQIPEYVEVDLVMGKRYAKRNYSALTVALKNKMNICALFPSLLSD